MHKISISSEVKTNRFRNVSLSLDALVRELTTYPSKIGVKNVTSRAFVGGHFKDELKSFENLISRTLIVLDLDEFKDNLNSLVVVLENLVSDYTYVAYSTASHTFEKPRIRLVFFPDHEIPKSSYKILVKNFIESLGALKHAIDIAGSCSAVQSMNLPERTHDGYLPWFRVNLNKNFVKLSDFLSEADVQAESQDIKSSKQSKISEEKVKFYLKAFSSASCDYTEWLNVGEALHHNFSGSDVGLEIWDAWSKEDSRYNKKDLEYKYKTFKDDKEKPITFATIIKKVKDLKDLKLKDLKVNGLSQMLVPSEVWVHVKRNLQPAISSANYDVFFDFYKIKVAFDVISKKNFIWFEGVLQSDYRSALITIKQAAALNNLAYEGVVEHVYVLSSKNKINSFRDLILTKNSPEHSDFENELEKFYATVEVEDNLEELKKIYLKKWLLQMMNVACFNEDSSKTSRHVLVFKGDQGIGKTTWFKSLLPKQNSRFLKDGVILNLSDSMSVLEALTHVFVELGELASTFKKSDIDQIKAFLTKSVDFVNIKYVATHAEYTRHTVFFASVNDDTFLNDDTGSTRFWILPVIKCDLEADVDMLMIYRGLYDLVKNNSDFQKCFSYNLTSEESVARENLNKNFETCSPLFEMFKEVFDCDKEATEYFNATQVLQHLGFSVSNITKLKRNEMATTLRTLGFKFIRKIAKFKTPPLKTLV